MRLRGTTKRWGLESVGVAQTQASNIFFVERSISVRSMSTSAHLQRGRPRLRPTFFRYRQTRNSSETPQSTVGAARLNGPSPKHNHATSIQYLCASVGPFSGPRIYRGSFPEVAVFGGFQGKLGPEGSGLPFSGQIGPPRAVGSTRLWSQLDLNGV